MSVFFFFFKSKESGEKGKKKEKKRGELEINKNYIPHPIPSGYNSSLIRMLVLPPHQIFVYFGIIS
jgi:hypothetical protein